MGRGEIRFEYWRPTLRKKKEEEEEEEGESWHPTEGKARRC
jgi:hypothetical protein